MYLFMYYLGVYVWYLILLIGPPNSKNYQWKKIISHDFRFSPKLPLNQFFYRVKSLAYIFSFGYSETDINVGS